MTLEELAVMLREFAQARDWEQFHTPKNLAMAVAGEAGELLAEFQWLTEQESCALDRQRLDAAAAEMADVLIYLVRLADVLGVDLVEAARHKVAENAQRYTVDQARGNARKM